MCTYVLCSIWYDFSFLLQDNVGCVFTIPDGSDRRHMGMMYVHVWVNTMMYILCVYHLCMQYVSKTFSVLQLCRDHTG